MNRILNLDLHSSLPLCISTALCHNIALRRNEPKHCVDRNSVVQDIAEARPSVLVLALYQNPVVATKNLVE